MPEIRIAYDLPSFDYAFTWTATEDEAAKLLDSQFAVITEQGFDPATFLNAFVAQAPAILRAGGDEVSMRGVHVMLTAWVLQLAAGNPESPGRVFDFLSTNDFEIVIGGLEPGKIEVAIAAHPACVGSA